MSLGTFLGWLPQLQAVRHDPVRCCLNNWSVAAALLALLGLLALSQLSQRPGPVWSSFFRFGLGRNWAAGLLLNPPKTCEAAKIGKMSRFFNYFLKVIDSLLWKQCRTGNSWVHLLWTWLPVISGSKIAILFGKSINPCL